MNVIRAVPSSTRAGGGGSGATGTLTGHVACALVRRNQRYPVTELSFVKPGLMKRLPSKCRANGPSYELLQAANRQVQESAVDRRENLGFTWRPKPALSGCMSGALENGTVERWVDGLHEVTYAV